MKISQSMMKMFIKLLILMMLFVIMFLISSFLYSARYWPDVYNYINANITIKRIPTISELELTVIEVDYTTEMYSTTDNDYIETSTLDDLNIDEFMKDEIALKHKAKRNIVIEQLKDYIELPSRSIYVDYVFLEEPVEHEISAEKNIEGDKTKTKQPVTGIVIEDNPTEVSEDPAVTKKYYTVQPLNNKQSKRCIDEEETTENTDTVTTEYIPKHTTTKEGYLVGDDSKNMVDEVTEEPVVITTKPNENELVNEEEATGYMKDLVDVSKLSTRGSEDVEMVTGKPEKIRMMPDPLCHSGLTCKNFAKTVFPWLVTIFVTNNTKDSQFNYFCDGALLNEKVIITGARCMFVNNMTWEPENVLVFLGKGNLQSFGGDEKVHKIREIIIHPNFTVGLDDKVVNDLALVVLEEAAVFTDSIQAACIHHEGGLEEAGTTAWGWNGSLIPIFFNQNRSESCFSKDEDIFCTTYGNEVALCPSYGGIYATRLVGHWCLQGIFHGDPLERPSLCFSKDVYYTSLKNYLIWIDDTIGIYKQYIL